jgi:hypothetical protein
MHDIEQKRQPGSAKGVTTHHENEAKPKPSAARTKVNERRERTICKRAINKRVILAPEFAPLNPTPPMKNKQLDCEWKGKGC